MSLIAGGLQVHLGPTRLGAPDDLESVILEFIDDPKHTLDVAVQELDSRRVAAAIVAARARGVRARIVLEGAYLVEDPPMPDPWASNGDLEENRIIHAALLRAGVDVITDLNPAIEENAAASETAQRSIADYAAAAEIDRIAHELAEPK